MDHSPAPSDRPRTRGGEPAPHLQPPWANRHFRLRCNRCMACIPVCPEGVLVRGRDGYPSIDYRHGTCTFCNECVERCERQALERIHVADPAWHRTAHIDHDCLELHSRFCRNCIEQCPTDAIRFTPAGAGRATPEVRPVLCNGCGACVRHCPVDAISIHELSRPHGDPLLTPAAS